MEKIFNNESDLKRENGFYISDNKTILNNNISVGAKALYSLLGIYAYGDLKTCYPSQARLAYNLNKSIRTIQRYLDELKNEDIISIAIKKIKTKAGRYLNEYTLLNKLTKSEYEQSNNAAKNIEDRCNEIIKANKSKKSYPAPKNKMQFNNYSGQRFYNYDELENELLNHYQKE